MSSGFVQWRRFAESVLRRLLSVVPTLLLASFLVFSLMFLVPGDSASTLAGEYATREQVEALRDELGLDRPFVVQYGEWLGHALRGDLGRSVHTGEPVMEAVGRAFPVTAKIALGGLVVAIVIGVLAGMLGARHRDRWPDIAVSGGSAAVVAMPSFWLGIIMVSVFSLRLGWLPATGAAGRGAGLWDQLEHLVMPAFAIGVVGAAEIAKQLRSAAITFLDSDAARTLRAKGLPNRQIVWKHTLKNSGLPLATIVGLQISRFLGATVIIETVFGVPGVGTLMITATTRRDLPIVQGVVLVLVVVVVIVNLLVDLTYRLIDPRIAA